MMPNTKGDGGQKRAWGLVLESSENGNGPPSHVFPPTETQSDDLIRLDALI